MRFRLFTWSCLALLPWLAACKSTGPRFDARDPASSPPVQLEEDAFTSVESTNRFQSEWLKPPGELFRLGPGDAIEIEVLGEPGRAHAFVGPDGKIYYGILPAIFVWGMTLAETKEAISKELGKQMLIAPEVVVTLKSVESQRVWLLGSVNHPGVYSLATPMTVLEAIVTAGGSVRPPGSREGVPDLRRSFLLRHGEMVKLDFQRLLSQGDMSQNLYLQTDDFLYLRSSLARNVYVLGGVAGPSILPYHDRLSLFSAVASCGGAQPYAQLSQVAIIRGSLTEPRIATVDYAAIRKGKAKDVLLQEGDIVFVPYVFYRRLALLVESAVQTFVSSVGYNYGSEIAGGTTAIQPGIPPPVVVPPTR